MMTSPFIIEKFEPVFQKYHYMSYNYIVFSHFDIEDDWPQIEVNAALMEMIQVRRKTLILYIGLPKKLLSFSHKYFES